MSGEFTQDFFTSRRNFGDGDTKIGELDRLWYDSITNTIRISDGVTPGGIIVSGGGGPGTSGFSGRSGYSGVGLSGYSGRSGWSGWSGWSGYSGVGLSGYSGATGPAGASGFSGWSGQAGGGVNPWIKETSYYLSKNGDRIIADTSAGSFQIDLPATPALGDYVVITDGANFRLNNLIVGRNGSTIEGLPDDVALDMQGVTFEFIYSGATWQVTATTGQSGTSGYSGWSGALNPWQLITANYYAANSNRLIGDTSAGSFTVYLPPSAVDGDYVVITDGANFALNNLYVDPNGGTIEGFSDIVALDMKGVTYEFIYSVSTWQVTGTTGASGTSGRQGPSGFSGYSGVGGPGASGYSGQIGLSGYSGSSFAGDYVSYLISGTGVSISGASGVAATPTISIGQPVAATDSVTFQNILIASGGKLQFQDDIIQAALLGAAPYKQITAAGRFYTNADALLGLTTADMKPGDFYYDDVSASIYLCIDTGLGYFDLLDLTVRA